MPLREPSRLLPPSLCRLSCHSRPLLPPSLKWEVLGNVPVAFGPRSFPAALPAGVPAGLLGITLLVPRLNVTNGWRLMVMEAVLAGRNAPGWLSAGVAAAESMPSQSVPPTL